VENYFQEPRTKNQEPRLSETNHLSLITNRYLKDLSNPNDLHEAKLLMLDISKAKFQLGWEPRLNINQTVELTVDWYKRYRTEEVYKICLNHIKQFAAK